MSGEPPVNYTPAVGGCTFPGCGTQETETVDGVHGRRCVIHPPTFLRKRAVNLLIDGLPDTALAYLRNPLREAS